MRRRKNLKKVLPCAFPPITSYPLIANMMSVLWTYKEQTMPWIVDRFIQLVGRKDILPQKSAIGTFYEYESSYNRPMFLSCPYLYSSRFDRTVLSNNIESFTCFAKSCIEEGYYLHACLDHYYFTDSPVFQRERYIHPTFIYGFDDEVSKFNIRDFFKDKYREGIAFYSELDFSYKNVDYQVKHEYLSYISIFKYRSVHYEVNIDKIRNDYGESLNGCDTRNVYREDYIYRTSELSYGIKYYDFLSDILASNNIDLRAFHVLVDHKTIQRIRIQYLNEKGYIKNSNKVFEAHEQLEKNCLLLRNMAIKAILTKNPNIVSRGQALCRTMKEEEKSFVLSFLDNL